MKIILFHRNEYDIILIIPQQNTIWQTRKLRLTEDLLKNTQLMCVCMCMCARDGWGLGFQVSLLPPSSNILS